MRLSYVSDVACASLFLSIQMGQTICNWAEIIICLTWEVETFWQLKRRLCWN